MKALIVDDHVLFAEAVQSTLERMGLEVRVVSTPDAALDAARHAAPDVVLVDVGSLGRFGLEFGPRLLDVASRARIIALTAAADAESVERALALWFSAYLTKDMPVARFVTSVRAVLEGDLVFPGRHARAAAVPDRRRTETAHLLARQLTAREREVLRLLVEAEPGSEIARRLGISRNTVRTHIQSILTKLQVHSRLEAAAFAVRHRLIDAGVRA